ncbi:MAG: helix-turn-helix transcriptional regulator [Candidatus Gastranaerophilaceae bacterium]
MNLEDIRAVLQSLTNEKITNSKLSEALSMKLPNISRKIKDRSSLKLQQFKQLENYFKIDLSKYYDNKDNVIKNELSRNYSSFSSFEKTLKSPKPITNEEFNSIMPTVTLEHIGIKPSCGTGTSVYENAEIVPVTLGLDLIQNIFKVSDPKRLKLFTASGDSMETTIYDCDLLLVDESRQDYNNGGIFIITINNEWYCKRLRLMLNGDLEIISDNPKYGIEIKHPNDEIEIKIIGKVIRNLSKGL